MGSHVNIFIKNKNRLKKRLTPQKPYGKLLRQRLSKYISVLFVHAHKELQVLKVKSAAANVWVKGPSSVPRLLTGMNNEALPTNDNTEIHITYYTTLHYGHYVMWTDVMKL